MKNIFFTLGGAGNVYFQQVKAKSISNNYAFSDILISPFIRRLLGHTNHNNIYNQLFDVPKGGVYAFPLLLLDIAFAKLFNFTLFTTLDLCTIKSKPLLSGFIYCGYFQDGVDIKKLMMSENIKKNSICESYDLCIHIRGGDFNSTNNSNEATTRLSFNYYDLALRKFLIFDEIKSIAVVTDDKESSAIILDEVGLKKYTLIGGNEIDDFFIINSARYVITSNSTFALISAISNNNLLALYAPKVFKNKFSNFDSLPFPVYFDD